MLPDTDDSIEAHVADTLAAGRRTVRPGGGHVDRRPTDTAAVAELVDDGARFDEAAPGPLVA